MAPAELVKVLSSAGLTLSVHDGQFIDVSPIDLITDIYRTLIRNNKDELLAYIKEVDHREYIEERAAIMEFDEGLTKEEAEREAEILYWGLPSNIADAVKIIWKIIPGAKIISSGLASSDMI